jgi:alkanesulfonate monooxygenase SsuD/methylene tetrahydromethanopterin reductase-like flavin-dependent oxidoreductase (luciferase family)
VYFGREPRTRGDERGRHAIAGPPEWVSEHVRAYVDAGADGFVLNLDHQESGLADRVVRFAEEVTQLSGGTFVVAHSFGRDLDEHAAP